MTYNRLTLEKYVSFFFAVFVVSTVESLLKDPPMNGQYINCLYTKGHSNFPFFTRNDTFTTS